MKNTKRILAVLTLMALLVCCVLLSVSANEPKKTFNAEGISNIEDILEYYSAEDFVADNYESEGPDSEYYSGDKSEVVSDPVNEDNKVLKVTGENNAYKVKADTDTLVVSFNIYYDASMVGEYRLNIKTLDANGEESITYTTLFTVNAGAGKFQYSVWDSELNNGEGGFVSADFENAAAAADTWYKVVVFFNASEGNYSFKILYNDKSGKTVQAESEKISLGNVSSATDIVLKSAVKQRGEKVFMYLDNVRLYTGTFERSSANKGYVTTRTFLDLEVLYNAEETDLQTQVRIARVFEELCLSGKYTPVLEAYEDLGISPDDVVSI